MRNNKSSFKVGDRVKIKLDGFNGLVGVIKELHSVDAYVSYYDKKRAKSDASYFVYDTLEKV